MQLMFELSKEHSTLPCAEVLACLTAEGISSTQRTHDNDVLNLTISSPETLVSRLQDRLAYTFFIDELLFSCETDIDQIIEHAKNHPLRKPGSIAIRCKNHTSAISSSEIISHLAEVYTNDRAVNLTSPAIELRVVIQEKTTYVGIKKAELLSSHFQKRRGHIRPFLAPVTLHPKLARALVNLSSVKKDQLLLDPFCGTGGILLEAGLIGVRVIGTDIEQKMIDGCRKTLEFYSMKHYELFCCDIGSLPQSIPRVDAIVTDFPYGKATTTKKEPLAQLYDRAFFAIASRIKKNKKVVVGLSDKTLISLGEKYLSLLEVYEFRVHRSLTRYFAIYKS